MAKAKVFISWSGPASKGYAQLLKVWIETCLQNTEPFISTEINKGSVWFSEIASQLEDACIGIVCLTNQNKEKPWVLFEAGALAMGMSKNKVCTLLADIDSTDITGPLTQFNHTKMLDKIDMLRLLVTINDALDSDQRVRADSLNKLFEMLWESLLTDFEKVKEINSVAAPMETSTPRDSDDIARETLRILRRLDLKSKDSHNDDGTAIVNARSREQNIWLHIGGDNPLSLPDSCYQRLKNIKHNEKIDDRLKYKLVENELRSYCLLTADEFDMATKYFTAEE